MRTRSRGKSRGFTLPELLVAMSAGMLVSVAAYLLAKNATQFFQSEARITAGQMAATLGLSRLTGDLSRAGFLCTPSIQTDPKVARFDQVSWPAGLAGLQAVTLVENGSVLAHGGELADSTGNGFSPDSIEIAGSFHTSERFDVRSIDFVGNVTTVRLQVDTVNPGTHPPIQRTCHGLPLDQCAPLLEGIFKAGRFLRVQDGANQMFGVIQSVTVTPTDVFVVLNGAPKLPSRTDHPQGYGGTCEGCVANPVSVVRYDIRSLAAHPTYGPLVAPVSAVATGDAGRTELVRVELDAEGQEIPSSLELVSELAVDLKFGVTVSDVAKSGVTAYPVSEPANANVYTAAPELMRAVQVRFSTRARVPDREVDVLLPASDDGRKLRFRLVTFGKPSYARMRTLYTDIFLANLAGSK